MASYRRRDRQGTRSARQRWQQHDPSRPPIVGSPLALVGATTLALCMLILSGLAAPGLGIIDEPLWQLQRADVFWRAAGSLLLTVAVVAIAATLLALLVTTALHTHQRSLGRSSFYALAVVALITVLGALFKDGWLPSVWPLYLLITLTSALFGIAIAAVMARAESPALAFVLMSLLTGFASATLLAGAVGLVLQPDALPIDGVAVTSADRVRLTQLLRDGSPRNMEPGSTKTLTLSAADLNQLGAWGLSLGDSGRLAFVQLSGERADVALSLRWAPELLREPVFLNVSGSAAPRISDGQFDPGITVARVGSLGVPATLANYLARGLYDMVAADPRFSGAVSALARVAIEDQALSATYGAMELPSGLREEVFGKLGDDEVVAVAFSQHLHLQRRLASSFAEAQTPPAERLATFVAASFQLAAQRHREFGNDAILENRLAIIALGISLGHPKISEFIAQLPPEFDDLGPLWRSAPLQNRTDWTRHFWLSAALTCLSDQVVSADIGQLKEELDAGSKGGSGFSFADLAADLAGVALASALTGDRQQARTLQRRLSESQQFSQFVPTLDNLPEGLSEQALMTQYGGISGRRYQAQVSQITERIAALPGYGDAPLPGYGDGPLPGHGDGQLPGQSAGALP